MKKAIETATCLLVLLAALSGCALLPSPQTSNLAPASPDQAAATQARAQGQEYFEQKRYREAHGAFRRALGADSGDARAKLGLAEVYLAAGQPQRALEAFEQVSRSPELRPVALQGKGLALLARDRAEPGCEILAQAVAEQPDLWRAWNGLGQCHDLRGQWDKAMAAYDKALAVNPAATVHNNRGFSLLMRGDIPAAMTEFQAAIRLDPTLAVARTNQRLALAWQGRYAVAVAAADPEDTAAALNDVGYIAILRGDLADASVYLKRAMVESPQYNAPAARNLRHLEALRVEAESGAILAGKRTSGGNAHRETDGPLSLWEEKGAGKR